KASKVVSHTKAA
ncbi:IMP dehydrogenase / GMP reductase domain protein, partial [Vibrio parahaemolyticus V-223/04]